MHRKGHCDKRLARVSLSYKAKALKPSLGRVAVSAFYSDRHSPIQDVKGQCNRHGLTPLPGGVANRLPLCSARCSLDSGTTDRITHISAKVNSQAGSSDSSRPFLWRLEESGQEISAASWSSLRVAGFILGELTSHPESLNKGPEFCLLHLLNHHFHKAVIGWLIQRKPFNEVAQLPGNLEPLLCSFTMPRTSSEPLISISVMFFFLWSIVK